MTRITMWLKPDFNVHWDVCDGKISINSGGAYIDINLDCNTTPERIAMLEKLRDVIDFAIKDCEEDAK